MHFRTRLSSAVVVLIGAAGLLMGCTKQGEGDRCDTASGGSPPGTNDCSSPLQCTNVATVGPLGDPDYRCCPPSRASATTSVCSLGTSPLDASPAVPDEASMAAEGSVEAGDDGADASDSADAIPSDDGAAEAETASGGDGGEAGAVDGAADVGADE